MMNLEEQMMAFNESINSHINDYNFLNLTKYILKLVISTSEKYDLKVHMNNLLNHITFTSNPDLKFQISEVSKVEFTVDNHILKVYMEVSHFGLMGSSSPLPTHYIENAILNDNGKNILDFTNVFTNQVVKKMYNSHFKYIMTNSYQKGLTDKLSSYILYTLGVQNFNRNNYSWNVARLVPYTSLLTMKVQSKKSILLILKHYFLHRDMKIFENIASYSSIEKQQQNSLGRVNHMLSKDLILGTQGNYINHKFRIEIFNLTWEKFLNFLPDGKNWRPLIEVVNYALKKPLKYDLRLCLYPEEAKLSYLNENKDAKLGWNTWLGKIPNDPKILLNVQT